ncbi:MAG: extracellular solute-binding protein [Clostridia bacterium]|nr:extracellular solute-binding protein [Clostridia bacterium]
MKKLLSLLLALSMLLSLAGFAAAEEAIPELNTTDEITITFLTWDDFELTQALADKFHELHPNITVEIVQTTTADCTATLTNKAADNDLPDVFFWLDLDPLLANKMCLDIAPYLEADEEAQTLLYPSLRKVGYVDGEHCLFMAGEFLPAVIYLDNAVFAKLNKELPPQDWKWEDMLELIETMTDPAQGIWAYNFYMGPVTLGPVALTDNAIGEFGWDGENYHFDTGWVEMVEKQAEYARLGYQAIGGSEAYLAVVPDDMWPGESGHVAIQMDAYWTMNNIYTQPAALERGLQMVPYNAPLGKDSENAGQFGWIDMVSISATTEHPREAYEVAKFMTWGKAGWLERAQQYGVITNAAGDKLYRLPGSLPMIQDDEVNAAMAPLFPDLGYWNDWEAYLANIQNPVTFGGRTIPGFNTFITDYYHGSDYNGYTGIEAAINAGAIDPYDYTDKLNEAGRQYYEDAMAVFQAAYGYGE